MTRPVVAFATPAWGRYGIVRACLVQRRRVIDALAAAGVDAFTVIVADDRNVASARAAGARVVWQRNDPARVGARFNAAIEYAWREGADWIVPIGSDSFIDPAYLLPLPDPADPVRTGTPYVAVEPTRCAVLSVAPGRLEHSAGPYMFHRSLLDATSGRPSRPDSVMVDTDTIAGIEAGIGRKLVWANRIVSDWQYVGFRVPPMMTTYRSLTRRWLVSEHLDPWAQLTLSYDADVVEMARAAMDGR